MHEGIFFVILLDEKYLSVHDRIVVVYEGVNIEWLYQRAILACRRREHFYSPCMAAYQYIHGDRDSTRSM